MRPCSLCGANAINQDCVHCDLRLERFSELPKHIQADLNKADRERGITSSAAASVILQRHRRLENLGRPPTVGLVGCGKKKLSVKAPAKNLYTGNLFRAALSYSEKSYDETYILSAAHDLIHTTTFLLPYDKFMSRLSRSERAAWGRRVVASLATLFPVMRVNFFILAGTNYAEPVARAAEEEGYSWTFNEPLEGLTLGHRLRWFKGEKDAQNVLRRRERNYPEPAL